MNNLENNNQTNNFAWVTVITKAKYDACVGRLYQLLKHFKSKYPMEILVSDDIEETEIPFLINNKIPIRRFKKLTFSECTGAKSGRYDDTLSKYYTMSLTEYDYVCFIDADTIIVNNIDYLWDKVNTTKMFNCFKAVDVNRLSTAFFFLKTGQNFVENICNIVKTNYILYTGHYTNNDEDVLNAYLKSDTNILYLSDDYRYDTYTIHFSGIIKFWNLLWQEDWVQWFFKDSIEEFTRKLILNYDLIMDFNGLIREINDKQELIKYKFII